MGFFLSAYLDSKKLWGFCLFLSCLNDHTLISPQKHFLFSYLLLSFLSVKREPLSSASCGGLLRLALHHWVDFYSLVFMPEMWVVIWLLLFKTFCFSFLIFNLHLLLNKNKKINTIERGQRPSYSVSCWGCQAVHWMFLSLSLQEGSLSSH